MQDERLRPDSAEQPAAGADAGVGDQTRGAAGGDDERNRSEQQGFKVHDRRFWALDEEERERGEEEHAHAPTFIEKLEAQLADKEQQLRDYIAAYKKEVVEGLEQTKQRLEREATQQLKQVRGQVAAPMMEVFDALDRSLQAAEQATDVGAVVDGLKLVRQLMLQKLGDVGLSRIEAVGQPFDPGVHEAVALTPASSEADNNLVTAEISPGFALDGRVLRPAKVLVAKLQS